MRPAGRGLPFFQTLGMRELLWWSNGNKLVTHSREVGMWRANTRGRCESSASQRIKMKYRRATNDRVEPNDDITFHVVYVSG